MAEIVRGEVGEVVVLHEALDPTGNGIGITRGEESFVTGEYEGFFQERVRIALLGFMSKLLEKAERMRHEGDRANAGCCFGCSNDRSAFGSIRAATLDVQGTGLFVKVFPL